MKTKKWFHLLLGLVVSVIPFFSEAHAKVNSNPISEERAASSQQTEPIVTVGPAGPTLISNYDTKTIGPGIELTSFERFDARGWVNGEVMTVDLSNSQVSADLLYPGTISSAKPLSEMAHTQGAIAGVNGDFFDINNTKAPLGTMIQNGTLLKGPQGSHTLTAGVDENGLGMISRIFLEGTVRLPTGDFPLTTLNQSIIPENGIGLYTSAWGEAQRPTGGGSVFEVTVSGGHVMAVSDQVGQGPIAEGTFLLVGRDNGASILSALSIGDEVSVHYGPKVDGDSLTKFAIGGNIKLVENGEVPANLNDSTTAPRTAVGFSEDGKTMILALVDGRQVASRGMTIKEMAVLMKEFGAFQSLNIDGGGSSTMVARMPGYEHAEVVNEPSDGSERSVPNGIGIFAKEGSGVLTDFSIETSSKSLYSHRVFPGLTRSFVGLGHDENYFPVEVGDISWKALPSDVGSFEEDGIFRAKKSGKAVAQAQLKSAKGTMGITVLGELDRIEASESYLGMQIGKASEFSVIGYDKNGYAAPIEARDIEINYDESVVDIKANADGSFTVTPKQDGGSTLVTMSVLDFEIQLPVTIGLATVEVSQFEDLSDWTFVKYPPGVGASIEEVEGREGNGIQLTYDFSTTTATRAAYLQASPRLELPGDVQKIGLWVKGDGNGAWLRTVITDASNTNYTLTLADQVNWTGWKYVETSLPEGIRYPVKLYRVYPVETNRNEQYTGQLVFDDLTVKVPPSIDMPEPPTEKADPLILQNQVIEGDRFTFAVLADSQFVAKTPNSGQAQMAREALRQIVAAHPDFLVINGDFVDTAWGEDFEFAKQLLDEEVGDLIPVYYIPGNHEIVGSGSLDNFLEVFGQNRFSFDHNGTRFILLDSSTGTFRTSDFTQLVELKTALDEAEDDPNIHNVVVMGHHPTRDPLPTANSQLSDRKEAHLLENWLTEFREDSRGKGAIYISGHAHTVNAERVEGVPYMVVGSSGKAPYGAADDGGFYAWTLFGIDPTPVPDRSFGPENSSETSPVRATDWVQAEVRPLLEFITMNAPETLSVGDRVVIEAIGHQAGNLSFPLRYPATVIWEGSENVFIGSGKQLELAEKSGQYAAIFNTETNKLTALKPEEIWMKVTSNESEAVSTILIQ